MVAAGFPLIVHPDHVEDPSLKALHTRMSLGVGAETYLRQQEAIIARADSRPDLPNIRVPSVVIVGDRDALTPPELSEEMARGLPDAQLAVIGRAGHMALAEQPDAVNAVLLSWLDRLGG